MVARRKRPEEKKHGVDEPGKKLEERANERKGDDEEQLANDSSCNDEKVTDNALENEASEGVGGATEDSEDDRTDEEEISNSEGDDDGIDDERGGAHGEQCDGRVASEDGNDAGSEEMESSDDDDVNALEYKLIPPMTSALTTDESDGKGISKGSNGREQARDKKNNVQNNVKNASKRIGLVEARTRKGDSKSGVIYLPRIPPGLDVTALRSLLSRITQPKRMWLRAETKEQRRRRQSLGGSRRKERFRDGWVELETSKEARRVVGLLNGRPMTAGKRRGRWAEDLWCLKYLKGFSWDDLTKEVFGGRERILRVRESVMQGRREKAWIEGRRKGGTERVRRFRQKRVFEDLDDVRAREAGERVDQEDENGGKVDGDGVDSELVGMLFKRQKT